MSRSHDRNAPALVFVERTAYHHQGSEMPLGGYAQCENVNDRREVVMPVWAWVLIIVLLVLLLTGGVYVRR